MDRYKPILVFDTDDPEFVRGFEAGRIWQLLHEGDEGTLDGQPFHSSNVEMVVRMLEAKDRDDLVAEFSEDGGWMFLVYRRASHA